MTTYTTEAYRSIGAYRWEYSGTAWQWKFYLSLMIHYVNFSVFFILCLSGLVVSCAHAMHAHDQTEVLEIWPGNRKGTLQSESLPWRFPTTSPQHIFYRSRSSATDDHLYIVDNVFLKLLFLSRTSPHCVGVNFPYPAHVFRSLIRAYIIPASSGTWFDFRSLIIRCRPRVASYGFVIDFWVIKCFSDFHNRMTCRVLFHMGSSVLVWK